ncbi:MAG TPA: SPOR domain-containing protein [Bacteroidota bacterium]
MNTKNLIGILLIAGALFSACTSSGESSREGTSAADSLARRRGSNFTTNQDTVTASVQKQSKTATRSASSSTWNADVAFTVQVGAYGLPQYALKAQQLAKERFGTYPVFNQYEASLKLYRVSVGKFDARADAIAFLTEIRRLFPLEYFECWVNTIAK